MAGKRFVFRRVVVSRGSAGELLVTAKPHMEKEDGNDNGNGNGNDNGNDNGNGNGNGNYNPCTLEMSDDDPPIYTCGGGIDGKGRGCILRTKELGPGVTEYWCEPPGTAGV